MRILTIGIALLFLGCAHQATTRQPSLGEQVPLLTGHLVGASGAGTGCYLNFMVGILNKDETYGTTMAYGEDVPQLPLMWPIGYTGYRVGSEIAVVDETGRVRAITGNRYTLMPAAANNDQIEPAVPGAFLVCVPPLPAPPSPSG
jgi:hypothetical protein